MKRIRSARSAGTGEVIGQPEGGLRRAFVPPLLPWWPCGVKGRLPPGARQAASTSVVPTIRQARCSTLATEHFLLCGIVPTSEPADLKPPAHSK